MSYKVGDNTELNGSGVHSLGGSPDEVSLRPKAICVHVLPFPQFCCLVSVGWEDQWEEHWADLGGY